MPRVSIKNVSLYSVLDKEIIAEEPSIHSKKKQFGESDVSNTICHSVKVKESN